MKFFFFRFDQAGQAPSGGAPRGRGVLARAQVVPALAPDRQATPADLADAALPRDVFRREPLPWDATFLAGKAFLAYRRAGGAKRSPLPGFLIGAHAAVAGYRLLTRDAARYRTYFPRLELVAP